MSKKVLVTGGTGYIGSWVVKYLLDEGHTVHVTVRDKNNKNKVQHLEKLSKDLPGTVVLFNANLLEEGSFAKAMEGCETVYHIASPFFMGKIKDAQKQFVDPAVNGTRNVLNTANQTASVKKVILTSSSASIYGDNRDMTDLGLKEYTEEQWNTTSSLTHNPYSYSKVEAEKAAWEMSKAQDRWKLVVINPVFVMGPSFTKASKSGSIGFIKDLLSGKMKAGVPGINIGFVDVRDVARAHIMAANNQEAEGRHIVCSKSLSMLEFSNIIEPQFPKKYKLPKAETPKFLLYLLGWMFSLSIKYVARNVGYPLKFNNSKSRESLGIEYIPIEKSVKDMVEQMEG